MTDNTQNTRVENDIAALSDPGVDLDIAGRALRLHPIKVRQLPAVMRALEPLIRSGANLLSDNPADWLALAAQGEHLIDAVAAACDQPVDWVGELEPAEFARLLFTVLEVNKDFFSRQIAPALERLNETLESIGIPGPGSPSGSDCGPSN